MRAFCGITGIFMVGEMGDERWKRQCDEGVDAGFDGFVWVSEEDHPVGMEDARERWRGGKIEFLKLWSWIKWESKLHFN